MRKSDIWHFKEGLMRELNKIFSEFTAFIGNQDKKYEALTYKILRAEKRLAKLEKRK